MYAFRELPNVFRRAKIRFVVSVGNAYIFALSSGITRGIGVQRRFNTFGARCLANFRGGNWFAISGRFCCAKLMVNQNSNQAQDACGSYDNY